MTIKEIREYIFSETTLSAREKHFCFYLFYPSILILWLWSRLLENK